MSRPHPLHWLSEHAGTGLKELPSNTAWLLSRALPSESEGSVVAGTRDRARKVRASFADATPIGDSVETRMKRARAAADRAAEAEDAALEAAQQSKESSEYAARVAADNRTRIAELKRDLDRDVEARVAEARRAADERVEQERSEARAEADEELDEQQRDAQAQIEAAQQEAEEDQERAHELVAEATERLAEARQLAEEATRAARAAAEEAHRQAQELADDAEEQAHAADTKVAAAEQLGREAETTAKDTARQLRTGFTNGDLGAHTKHELLELAAAIDIEGRTTTAALPHGGPVSVVPNPSSGDVVIGSRAAAEVVIYDVRGTRVRRFALANGENVVWDGRDGTGRRVASGVYFLRARGPFGEVTRTLVRVH